MAAVSSFTRDDFWSVDTVFDHRQNHCPYRFNPYMSKRRFDIITRELRLTGRIPPRFKDPFWQVRDLLKAWNDNMAAFFRSSWVICVDESMSIWHNRWTCPGWIFCPHKPHPIGNEYKMGCCALSGVMFVIALLEGKDHSPELGAEEFDEYGKTCGLLLRMLKSYFGTAKYIVLDSGFCVLKALVELKHRVIFACALIKKRK